MLETKDIQRSLKNLYDLMVLKIITLESYLSRSDCPLDDSEKAQYRTILQDSRGLIRKIKTIAKIL